MRLKKRIIIFTGITFLFIFLSRFLNILVPMSQMEAEKSATGAPFSEGATPQAVLHSLTGEERAWLREHPVIRVVQDPGWPPIEFSGKGGEPLGITEDYVQLIEKHLGMRFERVGNLSWQESYARLKRWEIDMTTSVAITPQRSEFWAFTKPYMKIPIVILSNANVPYIAGMKDLAGKTVAVVDGYAVTEWIPKDYPDIQLVKVNTAEEGIQLLQQGKVFAFVDNMLVIGYYLSKLKVMDLKIAGETPYLNSQAMAVRKDWEVLAGILQKALDSISETERDEIYRKWVPIRYEHGFNYGQLLPGCCRIRDNRVGIGRLESKDVQGDQAS